MCTPFLLALFLVANAQLVALHAGSIYTTLFLLQGAFYLLAIGGGIVHFTGKKTGPAIMAFYFVFMHVCMLKGLYAFLNGRHTPLWEKSLRQAFDS
jgi:hypothetical protein